MTPLLRTIKTLNIQLKAVNDGDAVGLEKNATNTECPARLVGRDPQNIHSGAIENTLMQLSAIIRSASAEITKAVYTLFLLQLTPQIGNRGRSNV